MKKIKLSKGLYAIVDDEDFDKLNINKWHANENRRNYYAQRRIYTNGNVKTIKMHREILGIVNKKGMIVDHKNRNGLDNRRCNLRIVSESENKRNRRVSKNKKSSKYRGVYKHHKKYQAAITINGNRFNLGYYNAEDEAKCVYDKACENPLMFLKNKLEEVIRLIE